MSLNTRSTSDILIISGSLSASVSNSATETTLVSKTIQGGIMGDNKFFDFELRCRLSTPLLTIATGTLRLKFGGTTLAVFSGASVGLNLSSEPFIVNGRVMNDASNAQDVRVQIEQPAGTLPLLLPRSLVSATWAVDTSVDQDLELTWQFGASLLGATLSAERFLLEMK